MSIIPKTPLYGFLGVATLLSSLACTVVSAQNATDYPAKQPIRLIVGYPAGGSTDLNGRLLADALAKKLAQKVVVENVGGAGGAIAAQRVVGEPADGYTLLLGAVNEIVITGLVNPNVKYDGTKDFTGIGLIGSQPMVLAASRKTGITNIDGYVDMVASGKSAEYSYGSSGVGTALHLSGEMINKLSKGQVQHVPYRGVAPLLTDMVSGQLDLGIYGLSSGLPHIKSGAITAIGVTADQRSAIAPEIPALSENETFKGLDVDLWFGLFGPKDIPQPIVSKLQAALKDIVNDKAFQEEYKRTGGTVITQAPDMAGFLNSEQQKFKQIVDEARIGKE